MASSGGVFAAEFFQWTIRHKWLSLESGNASSNTHWRNRKILMRFGDLKNKYDDERTMALVRKLIAPAFYHTKDAGVELSCN
ncbi:hypothetical protein SBF1_1360012 [Candidatus Desulfosporosinus infrequens]|uniref:Uncharacterized protein n=1 Tax=Candidatus Desulfosporosinus infrequens TaxID=2043169 RepID=A0A2U3K4G4_9FIRM|nr:hypothetical protein SBF1_1360012 [Candidatus Desulfosporosinus infrequens]